MLRTVFTLSLFTLPLASAGGATTEFLRLEGEKNGDDFGFAVARAGDVDADGFVDVLVGAPRADVPHGVATWKEGGRVDVRSGRDGATIHVFEGDADFAHLGWAVAGLGDVDGDGRDDVALGHPDRRYAFWIGGVTVASGKTGAILYDVYAPYFITDEARLGASLASLGDVDGDGVGDFAAGAPDADVSTILGTVVDAGEAIVFSGADGSEIRRFSGAEPGGEFGASVANAGDVNLDGRDDLVIGEPRANLTSALPTIDCGRVLVTSIVPGVTLHSTPGGLLAHGIRFGEAVAGVGDVNLDGRPDYAGGAPYADVPLDDAGFVRVHSGLDGTTLWLRTGGLAGERFGAAVAALGDQDGDGRPEVLAGARWSSLGSPFGVAEAGIVRVASGLDGADLDSISTIEPFAHFGHSIADLGDLDGDGRADFVAGAVDGNGQQFASGTASIVLTKECGASWWNYGPSLGGTTGVPALTLDAPPVLCASNVLNLGTSATSTAPSTLFLGLSEANLPTSFGAPLLVAPPHVTVNLTLPPTGLSLPVDHPCDASLCGVTTYLQLLVADPGAPAGVAFSPGLAVRLGS